MLVDNSLSIINRTGAYYLAKDLCAEFVSDGAQVRHWRMKQYAPEGIARKAAARLMMLEVNWLSDSKAFLIRDSVGDKGFRLFLDPLYVLRSRLTDRDIVLCHDVGPLTHSSLYHPNSVESYRLAYSKIQRHKPGIVFVSNWSQGQFRSLFGSDFRWLTTIPLYVRTELLTGQTTAVPGIKRHFFLTVGAFEARKNQIGVIQAYREGGFHEQGIDYILCGSRGAEYNEIVGLAKSVPGVVILDYLPDAQLRWLYAHAEAFVLPSFLEGFGMPALEAAFMGLLPIVSAGTSLVEAAGGVCIQVSPESPKSIAEAMSKALSRGPEERAETASLLRETASAQTKARFLARWRGLISAHQSDIGK